VSHFNLRDGRTHIRTDAARRLFPPDGSRSRRGRPSLNRRAFSRPGEAGSAAWMASFSLRHSCSRGVVCQAPRREPALSRPQYAYLFFLARGVRGPKDGGGQRSCIRHRCSAVAQAPDGSWGEHSRAGPTAGYDHITMTQVALYYEYSKDPAAFQALRRSTDFHKNFTYLDGTPVEVINDRNRYWDVDTWGQFGFSNFPDGRRYAEFLTRFFRAD